MNLNFDVNDFRPLIESVIEITLRRIQSEQPRDASGRVLLSKKEAARVLGISEATLDRLRKAGLPAVKLNGLCMFRPEALKAWAASREIREGDIA